MKKFLFLLFLCFLALIAFMWLAGHPGHVSIRWLGYDLETSITIFLAGLVLFLGALAVVLAFIYKLCQFPFRVTAFFSKRHQKKGKLAFYGALAAYKAKDSRSLVLEADSLQKFLQEEPLSLFFKAQAALQEKNFDQAENLFKQLSAFKNAEFLGLQGLIEIALKQFNYKKLEPLLQKAEKYYPSSLWLQLLYLDSLLSTEHFDQAFKQVQKMERKGLIGAKVSAKKKAFVLLLHGRKLKDSQNSEQAFRLLEKAYSEDEGSLPVSVAYASELIERAEYKRAKKILEAAWKNGPHRDLADLYLKCDKEKEPFEQLKAIQRLASFAPNHYESHFQVAKACLNVKLWGNARKELTDLIHKGEPAAELFSLMARLEREEHHDPTLEAQWLEKERNSHQKALWVCEECKCSSENWQGICKRCHHFDTFTWHPAH